MLVREHVTVCESVDEGSWGVGIVKIGPFVSIGCSHLLCNLHPISVSYL